MRKYFVALTLCLSLLCGCLLFGGLLFNDVLSVKKIENTSFCTVENIVNKLFDNKKIKKVEGLYNLDGKEDYIYIIFEKEGYAIFYKDTLELLEYSQQGDLPYQDVQKKKYYGGPNIYLEKDNERLKDIVTGKYISMSESQASNYSKNTRKIFLKNVCEKSEPCKNLILDEATGADPKLQDLIYVTSSSGCISNNEYFNENPTRGYNEHNTCGSVAAQLLLSYHNYYTDRRIIAAEHLNGGWTNATGDGDVYNRENYSDPEFNPNVCTNPALITSKTLGTNNNFYSYVISEIEPEGLTCEDTIDSDGNITHSHSGSSVSDVKNGINEILEKRLDKSEFTINGGNILGSEYPDGSVSIGAINSYIVSEIEADRPVMILMQKVLGGMDHWVLGYGHQSYIYPDTADSYEGYVVDFGWSRETTSVWINSSWCFGYVALQINHEHNYNVITENNINGMYKELRCGECGHRIVDTLFVTDAVGTTITGEKYPISGELVIPATINGKNILNIKYSAFESNKKITRVSYQIGSHLQSIGNNVFFACTNLNNVILPSTVTTIGAGAFQHCVSLTSINIPSGVTEIKDNTFWGCTSLSSAPLPSALTRIGEGAFASTAISNITIPNSMTYIGSRAFSFCPYITAIALPNSITTLGDCAFINCVGLKSIVRK